MLSVGFRWQPADQLGYPGRVVGAALETLGPELGAVPAFEYIRDYLLDLAGLLRSDVSHSFVSSLILRMAAGLPYDMW